MQCSICKSPVIPLMDMKGEYYIAYHSADSSKVFCSAKCSTQYHEGLYDL